MTPLSFTTVAFLTTMVSLLLQRSTVLGNVVSLTQSNIDNVLGDADLVFINFYADWCRFSNMLAPVFDDAAKKIKEEFPGDDRVVLAKVDCDREQEIASRFHINKYPTLKLFRGGQIVKKEYRGQRSADALSQYVREQARNPLSEVDNLDKLNDLEGKKRHVIGYFGDKTSKSYIVFSKLASTLRDDCLFHVALGPISQAERAGGDKLTYRAPNTKHQDELYTGSLTDHDQVSKWVVERCVPLVREITFENAEELTEEGLPFLILFHNPDDTEIVEIFTREVARQVSNEKTSVNFLTADGKKFAHPLHHLGKSANDLPVLAIDSFKHMYLFPHDVKSGIQTQGLLKQFIADLHSGKLHREFHHGPDPTTKAPVPPKLDTKEEGTPDGDKAMPRDTSDDPQPPAPPKITSPPESTFKKLAPSRNRYTILRDEL